MKMKEWKALSPEEQRATKLTDRPYGKLTLRLLIAIGALVVLGVYLTATEPEKPKTAEELLLEKYPELPRNSEWDGSVPGVTLYLRNNLNDFDSYEGMEWSNVVSLDTLGFFQVRHKYRAANAFGAKIIQNQIFTLDSSGLVVYVE